MDEMTGKENRAKLAKGWFKIADRDYRMALLLSDGENAFYEDACFHCQQVVEKLFKGVIVYYTGDCERIHDLFTLLDTIRNLGINVRGFADEDIMDLGPYYIRTRYDVAVEFNEEEARKAIETVEKVKRFVEHEAGLEGLDFDESWWESV